MDDDQPPFTIFEDPCESAQARVEAPVALALAGRAVLAEIILPPRTVEAQCDSALKHEMLLMQPEAVPQSILWSAVVLEEAKENFSPRAAEGHPLKSSPTKFPTPSLRRSLPGPSTSSGSPSIAPLRI